jgi:histidine ammonia-lyase
MAPTKHSFKIQPTPYTLPQLWAFVESGAALELSEEAKALIVKCRTYLDKKIEHHPTPIYGINTGFGSLYNISIEGHDLAALQENLVRSHACGTGAEVPEEVVKLMLLLKVQSLSYGHSGIHLEVAELLVAFYNHNILPVVYEQGSLGASGDLAPLAHLSLPLMGEGEVRYKGKQMPAAEALKKAGLNPIQLQSKEGLALLNGTQFMAAFAGSNLRRLYTLSYLADLIATISLEGYDGRVEPFDPLIHQVRPHKGQQETAARVRGFLEGSVLIAREKAHVQDPYSFRCVPQVHGATKDALRYISSVLTTEVNAVTDNPTIFPDEDKIISGGNFHGQNLALTQDMLAIAAAELANISERRTYLLLSGQRELPPFLVARPGLNSGLMIAQYTAASIVSQNKQLCTPASVDSVVSSNGQEDHVSMGANAATKAHRVVENLETVLAIELIAASQALGFRKDTSSPFIEDFISNFRASVPFIEKDRIISHDIAAAKAFLQGLEIDDALLGMEA